MALHQGHNLLPKLGAELSFMKWLEMPFLGQGRRHSNSLSQPQSLINRDYLHVIVRCSWYYGMYLKINGS